MNWDQQIWQILVMNKSAVSVLLFALFHSRNANKMVNIVLEQSLARIKNHIFFIAQSWDVKPKLMPYLSWFSAQFWKRSKFLLFVSAYHYQHIIDIFLVFLLLSSSVHGSVYSVACENIRFSSLFAAGDVSRGGTSATQRQKFHTDDVKSVRNAVRSADWSTE